MKKYILDNGILQVEILSHGATLYSIKYKGKECLLHHQDIENYRTNPFYLGATVGPLAGRVSGASFDLDGKTYKMQANEGTNFLHSGPGGISFKDFEEKGYQAKGQDAHLVLECISEEGETGIPGKKRIEVEYRIQGPRLTMVIRAESDKATYINITNHAYFNLNADKSLSVANHLLEIGADKYVAMDSKLIAKEIRDVEASPFDFRKPKELSYLFENTACQPGEKAPVKGLDHPYIFGKKSNDQVKASISCPEAGLRMDFFTTYPAANIYTANSMDGGHKVNEGIESFSHQGICFEGQYVPDYMNHDFLEGPVIMPGRTYEEKLAWEFSEI